MKPMNGITNIYSLPLMNIYLSTLTNVYLSTLMFRRGTGEVRWQHFSRDQKSEASWKDINSAGTGVKQSKSRGGIRAAQRLSLINHRDECGLDFYINRESRLLSV